MYLCVYQNLSGDSLTYLKISSVVSVNKKLQTAVWKTHMKPTIFQSM